jgi:hypothetical protein
MLVVIKYNIDKLFIVECNIAVQLNMTGDARLNVTVPGTIAAV